MSETKTPAIIEVAGPKDIILDQEKREALFSQIRATIAGQEPDLTCDKGRKAVASLAYCIAQAKTAVEKAGKELTADLRAQVDAVNKDRNAAVGELQKLQDLARRPLDEWEKAAAGRKARREAVLNQLARALQFRVGATSDELKARRAEIEAVALLPEDLEDATAFASASKHDAIIGLTRAIEDAERAEKDAAELAELRRIQAERDEADRQRAAAEAAAALAETKRLLDEERARAARAEADARRAEREAASVKAVLAEHSQPVMAAVPDSQKPSQGCGSIFPEFIVNVPVPPDKAQAGAEPEITMKQAEDAANDLCREAGLSKPAALRIVALIRNGKIQGLRFG